MPRRKAGGKRPSMRVQLPDGVHEHGEAFPVGAEGVSRTPSGQAEEGAVPDSCFLQPPGERLAEHGVAERDSAACRRLGHVRVA